MASSNILVEHFDLTPRTDPLIDLQTDRCHRCPNAETLGDKAWCTADRLQLWPVGELLTCPIVTDEPEDEELDHQDFNRPPWPPTFGRSDQS